jgi:hypothetical protein
MNGHEHRLAAALAAGCVTIAAALLLASQAPAAAQPPAAAKTGFALSPGAYIDPEQGHAYVMDPAEGIDAVNIPDGTRIWKSTDAARPLGTSNNLLVCQVAAPNTPETLRVVGLETKGGRAVGRAAEAPLPPGVRATIHASPHGRFEASARSVDGATVVSWEYHPRTVRGVPPGADRRLAPPRPRRIGTAPTDKKAATPAPATPKSGRFHLNLSEGTATRMDLGAGQPAAIPASPHGPGPAKWIPDVEGEQSLSADGRHVLVTRLTADDTVWDKYSHAVYDRETRRRLGEFKSHQAALPFALIGDRVLYETTSYRRRTAAGVDDQPLTLHALDLASGREIWRHPVRDTTYHGPLPP